MASVNEREREATTFEAAHERWSAPLHSLAGRVLGDAAEAEDVVQEVFLRLARDPVLARPSEEVGAWCRRVCLNLAFNAARTRSRAHSREARHDRLESRLRTAEGPLESALRAEGRESVRRALAALPPRQRDALLLRHSGLSYAEVAAILEIAPGSVGVLLARGERAFRAAYQTGETIQEDHDDLS